MPKYLRVYNKEEAKGFRNLFDSKEYETNRIYQSLAEKMFRHEYCLVGNDLVKDVLTWFERCGLKVRVVDEGDYQTEIELI